MKEHLTFPLEKGMSTAIMCGETHRPRTHISFFLDPFHLHSFTYCELFTMAADQQENKTSELILI